MARIKTVLPYNPKCRTRHQQELPFLPYNPQCKVRHLRPPASLFFKKVLSLAVSFFPKKTKKRKNSQAIFSSEKIATVYEVNGSTLKDLDSINNKQKSCQVRKSLDPQGFDGVPMVGGR